MHTNHGLPSHIQGQPSRSASLEPAPAAPLLQTSPHVLLHVSLDEEHVTCAISLGHAAPVDLGERGHHYCLLTLARLRIADAARGLDATSQGWVDNDAMATMLGLDTGHLNIQVHRLRRQVVHAFPTRVIDVVERRRGQMRFGTLAVSVTRGALPEGSLYPAPQDSAARFAT